MKETELKLCRTNLNLTSEGEKIASKSFTDLVKGFDEVRLEKHYEWIKEYCEGRADNEQREAD